MVSVITVVRNGSKTLEQTIISVLNQVYSEFEYIVIDGASTDGTIEILQKYKDELIYISEPDKGIYDAMNKGLSIAKGEWIYFLGSDDLLYNPSVLNEVFLNQNYEAFDVVYGNVYLNQSNKIFDGEFDYNKHAIKSICQQAIFYRKTVFFDYGYFDLNYKNAADYVFNIKLFCNDKDKWKYVDIIISVYNELGASATTLDSFFHNNCFEIKYLNFRKKVSDYTLTRIFFSSFLNYFRTHPLKISIKYFICLVFDVGPVKFLINFLKISFNRLLPKG